MKKTIISFAAGAALGAIATKYGKLVVAYVAPIFKKNEKEAEPAETAEPQAEK